MNHTVWGIHAPANATFLHDNIVALGIDGVGDLSALPPTREAFQERYKEIYKDLSAKAIIAYAGMLYRFAHEATIGDYIVYPSKIDKYINIGAIDGEYTFQPSSPNYTQQRKVKWLQHIPRESFSQGALHEIGSAMAFFAVKNHADEFISAAKGGLEEKNKTETVQNNFTVSDITAATKKFILNKLSDSLKGYAFEGFVAELLHAMGYRTTSSPQGGDSGIDIIAYKDELPPRIIVQVKSQDSDIAEATLQSLKGAMKEGDYGLFITLSDYTKNARRYLSAMPIIRGINGIELCDLIFKYYDKLPDNYRSIIPLQKIYVPGIDVENK